MIFFYAIHSELLGAKNTPAFESAPDAKNKHGAKNTPNAKAAGGAKNTLGFKIEARSADRWRGNFALCLISRFKGGSGHFFVSVYDCT